MNDMVLVTGGAGFIGSHLVQSLLDCGYDVQVIDDLSTGRRDNLPSDVPLFEVDIRDAEGLERIFEETRFSQIFHLAAHIDVLESMKQPAEDASVNVVGTLNLLEQAIKHGVPRIINVSSYCAYGSPDHVPVTEDDPVRPLSFYGLSKLYAEQALMMAEGIEVVSFRGGNIYGPGQRVSGGGDGGLIPILFRSIIRRESPVLRGFGKSVRDYTYIDDACTCIRGGIGAPPGIYNIGTGKGTTGQEVWDIVSGICRERGYEIPSPDYRELSPGEIRQMVVSSEKARAAIGWVPKVDIRQGITASSDYYLSSMVMKDA